MGDNYTGTEHILLALLELDDGTGALAALGMTKARAEAIILTAVEAPAPAHDQPRPLTDRQADIAPHRPASS